MSDCVSHFPATAEWLFLFCLAGGRRRRRKKEKRESPLQYSHCPNPDNEALPCNYLLFLKPSVFAGGELTLARCQRLLIMPRFSVTLHIISLPHSGFPDGVTSRRREEEEVFSLSRQGQFSSAVTGPPGFFLTGGLLDSGSQTGPGQPLAPL